MEQEEEQEEEGERMKPTGAMRSRAPQKRDMLVALLRCLWKQVCFW